MKRWYRVNHINTEQGLWYDFKGDFTGLIHNDYSFCSNSSLKMDFDPELVGYISAVESLDDLFKWFNKEDIAKLQDYGFFIHVYESEDSKFYEFYNHTVIKQETAKLLGRFIMPSLN